MVPELARGLELIKHELEQLFMLRMRHQSWNVLTHERLWSVFFNEGDPLKEEARARVSHSTPESSSREALARTRETVEGHVVELRVVLSCQDVSIEDLWRVHIRDEFLGRTQLVAAEDMPHRNADLRVPSKSQTFIQVRLRSVPPLTHTQNSPS